MTAYQQVIKDLAGVRDEIVLHPDEERVLDYFYDLLAGAEFEGLAIRTPKVVDVTQHQEIPMILVSQETAARTADVPLGDNCFIVASHRESARFWIGPAFRDDLSKIPMPEQPQGEDSPAEAEELSEQISTKGIERIDLVERLELSAEPGRYAITAIAFNWVSNTGATTLVDPRAGQAAERQIAPQHAVKVMEFYQRNGEPGEKLPDFRRSANSPPLGEIGAALAVPPSVAAFARTLTLHGSFRVSIRRSWTVAPSSEGAPGDLPDAIVRAMVLLAQKGVNMPKMVELDVPVFASGQLIGKAPIEGYFSIDLADYLDQPIEPGAYNAYLVVAGFVAGPYPLQVEPPQ